ncbi:MAG: amidohydrolase, partial [Eudoraea sp.]|nr:amidohydrolase [Eudoraea sp.]
YMEWVLNAFGPGRIMYGSDWPVCLVAGEYQQVKKLVSDFIAKLSTEEQQAIMGLNAMEFYNLK